MSKRWTIKAPGGQYLRESMRTAADLIEAEATIGVAMVYLGHDRPEIVRADDGTLEAYASEEDATADDNGQTRPVLVAAEVSS